MPITYVCPSVACAATNLCMIHTCTHVHSRQCIISTVVLSICVISRLTLSFFSIKQLVKVRTSACPRGDCQLVTVVIMQCRYPANTPPPLFCLMLACRKGGRMGGILRYVVCFTVEVLLSVWQLDRKLWLRVTVCRATCLEISRLVLRGHQSLIAERISMRHHNPVRCWVAIIMITFCFRLPVIWLVFS